MSTDFVQLDMIMAPWIIVINLIACRHSASKIRNGKLLCCNGIHHLNSGMFKWAIFREHFTHRHSPSSDAQCDLTIRYQRSYPTYYFYLITVTLLSLPFLSHCFRITTLSLDQMHFECRVIAEVKSSLSTRQFASGISKPVKLVMSRPNKWWVW